MRFPVLGAALQRARRHRAARRRRLGLRARADALGVDIIQSCEVTGIRREGDRVVGVETTSGYIGAGKIAVVTAGHTSTVMAMAGLRMPLESVPLQALVSEPVKPCFPCVVMSNTIHAYISQSDKGELVIGAGSDQFVSYSQRGSFQVIEHTLEAICELFPMFRRMRMLRQWAGIVDITADRSPIIGKLLAGPLRQLRLGHRRLQGDAGLGARLRPHGGEGRAAPDQRAVHAGAVHDRAADRRGGGGAVAH